jgi:hypothetical protein
LAAIFRQSTEQGEGAVAQLGERVVRNDEVSGSIPLSSTNHKSLILMGFLDFFFTPHLRDIAELLGIT